MHSTLACREVLRLSTCVRFRKDWGLNLGLTLRLRTDSSAVQGSQVDVDLDDRDKSQPVSCLFRTKSMQANFEEPRQTQNIKVRIA